MSAAITIAPRLAEDGAVAIVTCLIVAIRTQNGWHVQTLNFAIKKMNEEIEFAAYTARRVMMTLMAKFETIFPSRKEPWYQANDEDVPK